MSQPSHPLARAERRDASEAPFAEHVEELRRRLAWCLGTIVVASGIGLWLARPLISWLKRPAGDLLPTLAFLSPIEAISAHLKVGMAFGIVCAVPVVVYHGWAFVRPGLADSERRMLLGIVGWGSALFVVGAGLAYGLLLPWLLRFLLTFGGPDVVPVITISRYVSFALGVVVGAGVLFELPMAVLGLVRLGVISPEGLRRTRGVALVVLVGVVAVLSPTTDAVSLLVCALPLWLLYEASILLASWKRRP